MKIPMRVVVASIVAAVCVLTGVYVWKVLNFHGVSRSENVYIIDSKTSSSNRVAMIVERSDHAALSGNTFFVFVSDRPYQISELRKRLYALYPVFQAGRGAISLGWSGPSELTIRCEKCGLTKDLIETQLFSQNGSSIRYADFP